MLDRKIKRIKFYFIALGTGIIVVMFLGIVTLSKSPYLETEYFAGKVSYLKYWAEYVATNEAFADTIRTAFDRAPTTYENYGQFSADIPVLVYHGLLSKDDGSKGLNTTVENFKNQMFEMKRAGYETITVDELYRYLKGENTLPEKSFLLTFDDGRRDSYYNADPILRALGYEAVMFAISHQAEQESDYYMSEEELKHMEKNERWEVQAHTYKGHGFIPIDNFGTKGNFYSNKMWLENEQRLETDEEFKARVEEDIRLAKESLEETLEKEVTAFTFPFGDFGQFTTNHPAARDVLVEAVRKHYPLLFYQFHPGMQYTSNYYDASKKDRSLFMVRRVDYNRHWTDRGSFVRVMESLRTKPLPYSDTLGGNKGWIAAWGEMSFANDSVTIYSKTPEAGGAIVLDGSGAWKDYEVRAVVNSPGQDGAYLWVRFDNELQSAACNFGNGFAHVEQTVNGEKRVIKGIRNENINIPAGDFEIIARVKGRMVECILENEASVATEFLDRSLSQGGIGFKTWAQGSDNSLIIRDLRVSTLADEPEASR